jgi:hypothetical protein
VESSRRAIKPPIHGIIRHKKAQENFCFGNIARSPIGAMGTPPQPRKFLRLFVATPNWGIQVHRAKPSFLPALP